MRDPARAPVPEWRRRAALVPLFALLSGPAAQGNLPETDVEQSHHGTRYVCTGVGESKRDPRWDAYSLKLVFAGVRGAYVGDMRVRISDAGGNEILDVHCLAPWVLAALEPGRYTVTATANGEHTKEFPVEVAVDLQTCKTVRYEQIVER